MKSRIQFFTSVLLLATCFFSCSKKENKPVNLSTLSYKVNGTLVLCDNISIGQGTASLDDIAVEGKVSTDNKHGISISIKKDATGDSAIYVIFATYKVDAFGSWGGGLEGTGAVLNVTVNNAEKVQGTFSCQLPNTYMPSRTIMITDGTFEVYR